MPTRREKRTYDTWEKWIKQAAAQAGMRQIDLVNASDGRLPSSTVSKWFTGDMGASPRLAVIAADILQRPRAEALRAADHAEIAEIADGAPDQAHTATWSAWMNSALRRHSVPLQELADKGIATAETLARWTNGTTAPRDPDQVIEIAHAIAPDETPDALEAAGFTGTAKFLRTQYTAAAQDPVIARIRREGILTATQRRQIEAEYREWDEAETRRKRRYFELQIAAAIREARENDTVQRMETGEDTAPVREAL